MPPCIANPCVGSPRPGITPGGNCPGICPVICVANCPWDDNPTNCFCNNSGGIGVYIDSAVGMLWLIDSTIFLCTCCWLKVSLGDMIILGGKFIGMCVTFMGGIVIPPLPEFAICCPWVMTLWSGSPCIKGNTMDFYWKGIVWCPYWGGICMTFWGSIVWFWSWSMLILDSPLSYWISFSILIGAWSIKKSSLFLISSSYLFIHDQSSFSVNLFSG